MLFIMRTEKSFVSKGLLDKLENMPFALKVFRNLSEAKLIT